MRQSMGEAGRKHGEREFDIRAIVPVLAGEYRQVAEESKRS
jgi:hypothetical protein